MARALRGLVALPLLLAAGVAGAQPANDDCANATVIGALPFTDEVDTSLATTEPGDPSGACTGGANVWYMLPAIGSDRNIYADVFQSDNAFADVSFFPGTCGAFGAELGQCGTGEDNGAAHVPAGTTVYIHLYGAGQVARVTIDEVQEFLVTDDGNQYAPQGIGGSPDGRFVVAWNPALYTGITAEVFDGSGASVSGEVGVDAGGGEVDADGLAPSGFVVTWAASTDVFMRRLDADGVPQGAAAQVNDGTGGEEPRAATDGSGNFVIAWENTGPSFRLFDSSGTPTGPQVDVPQATDEPVDVAMDAAGNFVVTWWNGDVFAQRFDSTGTSLGAPFVVNDTEYPPDYTGDEHAVAMSATGDFLVAWEASDDEFDFDLARARVFDATGAPRGGSFPISEVVPGFGYTKHRLRADDDGTGDFIVVWEDDGGRTGYGGTLEMLGRRVSSAGAVAGPIFQLSTANWHHQYDPNVAGGPNGEFMVVWNSYRAEEPWGSDYAVPARIFGSDEARYDSACAAAPVAGCITPVVAAASQLLIRDQDDDSKDQLKWKLTKGDATTAEDFANPAQANLLGVCLYDAADALVYDGRLLPGGECGTKPCWKALGKPPGTKGYKYKNPAGAPDGVQKAVLKPGEAGKTKIVVKGGKENLSASPTGFDPLPLALPARMQLQGPGGRCWEATFEPAGVVSATDTLLRAKSATP